MLLQSKSCEYKQRVRAHVDSAHLPLQRALKLCVVLTLLSLKQLFLVLTFSIFSQLYRVIYVYRLYVCLSSHCWTLCTVICAGGLIHEFLFRVYKDCRCLHNFRKLSTHETPTTTPYPAFSSLFGLTLFPYYPFTSRPQPSTHQPNYLFITYLFTKQIYVMYLLFHDHMSTAPLPSYLNI